MTTPTAQTVAAPIDCDIDYGEQDPFVVISDALQAGQARSFLEAFHISTTDANDWQAEAERALGATARDFLVKNGLSDGRVSEWPVWKAQFGADLMVEAAQLQSLIDCALLEQGLMKPEDASREVQALLKRGIEPSDLASAFTGGAPGLKVLDPGQAKDGHEAEIPLGHIQTKEPAGHGIPGQPDFRAGNLELEEALKDAVNEGKFPPGTDAREEEALLRAATELLNSSQVEIARWGWEINGRVSDLGGNYLAESEEIAIRRLNALHTWTEKLGLIAIPTAVSPIVQREHLTRDHLTTKTDMRYQIASLHALKARGGEPWEVDFGGESPLNVDSIIGIGLGNSYQVHLQPELRDLVDLFNISQMITGFVMAPAVGSPTVCGERGDMESRQKLFGNGWDKARVFSEPSYIAHPIEPLALNAELEPVFLQADKLPQPNHPIDLRKTMLQNGGVHRRIRMVLDASTNEDGETEYHLRIELRQLAMHSAPIDNSANKGWYEGLAYGYLNKIRTELGVPENESIGRDRIEAYFGHTLAAENEDRAAEKGLDAILHFPVAPGRSVELPARDLWHNVPDGDKLVPGLREIAIEGLRFRGTAEEDIARYISGVEVRPEEPLALSPATSSGVLVNSVPYSAVAPPEAPFQGDSQGLLTEDSGAMALRFVKDQTEALWLIRSEENLLREMTEGNGTVIDQKDLAWTLALSIREASIANIPVGMRPPASIHAGDAFEPTAAPRYTLPETPLSSTVLLSRGALPFGARSWQPAEHRSDEAPPE